MTVEMTAGTREAVLEQILARILAQEDDNDREHDGYQRRIVMVEGHTNEDAEDACKILTERVRDAYAGRGRSSYELSIMRCENPPGQRRYEFGPAHAQQIMKACAMERETRMGALHTVYRHEFWTEPKLLFISNADAMAQAGRNAKGHWTRAGDLIRRLSDVTRVRQVLFGSAALRNIYETNKSFQYRTDAYHLGAGCRSRSGMAMVSH